MGEFFGRKGRGRVSTESFTAGFLFCVHDLIPKEVMSDSENLKKVVHVLFRENNMKLKGLFQNVLQTITGEFLAAGLIEQEVAGSMLTMGLTELMLASKLFNACQDSVCLYPGENFPKFIEVLKGHETMKPLATAMEAQFKQVRESYLTSW